MYSSLHVRAPPPRLYSDCLYTRMLDCVKTALAFFITKQFIKNVYFVCTILQKNLFLKKYLRRSVVAGRYKCIACFLAHLT